MADRATALDTIFTISSLPWTKFYLPEQKEKYFKFWKLVQLQRIPLMHENYQDFCLDEIALHPTFLIIRDNFQSVIQIETEEMYDNKLG